MMKTRGAFLLCGVLALAGSLVTVVWRSPTKETADVAATSACPSSPAASPALPVVPFRPSDPHVREATFDVPDAQHVPVAELVRQGTALARRLEPDAELVAVGATGLRGGMLDLRSAPASSASLAFNFSRRDPAQPPGRDVTEGGIRVSLSDGVLRADARHVFDRRAKALGALPVPVCTVEAAWTAAVKSGAPREAIVDVTLWRLPLLPPVWSLSVAGHPEHRREIDVTTCAVRPDPASAKHSPRSASKHEPAGKADCGCGEDWVCQMKCFPR